MLPVQAGRGCNLNCSFCSIASMYSGRYLSRPIDEVIRDIQAIKDLGFKRFYLLDDNIVSNPKYLKELCREIEPLKMKWASQCTLHLAKKPALMDAVLKSGGNMMSFGVESITQEGLDKLGKGWLKVDEHKKLIRTLVDAGILVTTEMMLGTDSDTEESIQETYKFIKASGIAVPRFYILTPSPGTPLFDEYKSKGRLLTEDLEKFDGAQCVHTPAKISAEKLTEMYWWLYKKLFSVKNILQRSLFHPAFRKAPFMYLFAFFVNIHYRKYIKKQVPPNIF